MQKQILEIDTGTGPSVRMVELAETLVKPKRSDNVWLFLFIFFLIHKDKKFMTRRFSAMVLYPSSAAWSIDTIDPSKKIHELLYKDKAKCQKLKAKHYRIYKII